VGGRRSGPRARALRRQFSKPGGGGTVSMETMFWGEGCHRGVTVGVVVTVGDIGVTDGTMVVTVEGWFITVVGAWWGGSAEQGGQTQPSTLPRENMDLRVSSEQVEWTHILQRMHWIEVRPTSRKQTEQRYMGFVGRTEPGLGWTLPLASRRRKIKRRVKGGK